MEAVGIPILKMIAMLKNLHKSKKKSRLLVGLHFFYQLSDRYDKLLSMWIAETEMIGEHKVWQMSHSF